MKEKIIRLYKKLVYITLRAIVMLKKFFTKKAHRIYKVVGSSTPSMIGARFIGAPKVGRELVLLTEKKGYLTLQPATIKKIKVNDRYIIYGKYARITVKRIR